jgi:DNA repair exonuclease SbcCD ATPase subunit
MANTKTLKNQVSQLESDLATLQQDHASIQAALSEAETDLTALLDSYRQNAATIDAVVNKKSKITALQDILTKLDTSISETEAELIDATAALERHQAESAIPDAQQALDAAQSAYRDHQRQILQTIRASLAELETKAEALQDAAQTVKRLHKLSGNSNKYVAIYTDAQSAFTRDYPDLGGEQELLSAVQAFRASYAYPQTEAERQERVKRAKVQAEHDRVKSELFRAAKERAAWGDPEAWNEYYAKYGNDEEQRNPSPRRLPDAPPSQRLLDLIHQSRPQ